MRSSTRVASIVTQHPRLLLVALVSLVLLVSVVDPAAAADSGSVIGGEVGVEVGTHEAGGSYGGPGGGD